MGIIFILGKLFPIIEQCSPHIFSLKKQWFFKGTVKKYRFLCNFFQ